MAQAGVERNQELQDGRIYVDIRSTEQKIADWLLMPDNLRNVMVIIALLMIVLPLMIPGLLFFSSLLYLWFGWKMKNFRMPLRYPEHSKTIDPSERDDNMGVRKGQGIEFMGVERKGRTITDTLELWASDSDVRTHRIILGTTGAGKTFALLSILFNPLCWGSGFSMTDGKAQIDVTARVFIMSWIFWREDDVLVLNYMRGGQDRYHDLINKPKVGVRKSRVSNTWNPFASANHETISQIIDSIMEKATGDSAQWQGKAINMKNAVVQAIAYFRAAGTMLMSVSTIREQMSLDNIIKLAMRNDLPPVAAVSIRNYLSVGLPGFNWQKAKAGKPQDGEALLQHGYLTGQFTRTLGLMSDTYNDIFGDEIPEFDTSDVILNNRISMTMIPTLEKGVEEAGNLGKMQVASSKMMMAENLGYELEGSYEDVVENRPTNTHRPFYIAMDEIGYYFAPGIDLMFAQGRSLNIALIAAGQDLQAMGKTYSGEVDSMVANTRFKQSMKLEDPTKTYEMIQKAAGQGAVARQNGFEIGQGSSGLVDPGFINAGTTGIENVDRVSLQELKSLGAGDGVMVVGSKVIRYKGFNLLSSMKFDKKINLRINTFLPIAVPEDFSSIASYCKQIDSDQQSLALRLLLMLRSRVSPPWAKLTEAKGLSKNIEISLIDAADVLNDRPSVSPEHRAIVLFMAAIRAMEKEETVAGDDESAAAGGGVSLKKNDKKNDKDDDEGDRLDVGDEEIRNIVERFKTKDANPAEPDWLSNPPVDVKENNVTENSNENDDIEFGPGESSKDESVQVVMTDTTRKNVESIIADISGEASVDAEIRATEAMLNKACAFSKPGEGSDDDPAAKSDPNEVLDMLNSISSMLSKK